MMPTEKWNRVILREICDLVNYGYTASANPEPIGPKFLRITDIVPNRIDWTSVPHCKIDDEKLSKYRLKENDIVIARTGATTGYAKRIRTDHKAVFASYLVRIRVNSNYDSQYVGFVIESDEYKKFIQLNLGGAAQPQANAQVLTSFPIPLPPLCTQRKIAAILFSYDDLIENNTRRIKILEDMAQTLYREWFVHFRFPGHENVPMVESPLGPIPRGWKVIKYSDIVDLSRKGINPSKFPDEIFAHFSIPAFDNGCMPTLDTGSSIRSFKYLITEKCVLVSKLNPRIPRVWFPFLDAEHRAVTSTEFLTLSPKPPLDCVFLYSLCNSPDFSAEMAVRALGTSGSHQRVKPDDFLNMLVLMPTEFLLNSFRDKVRHMLNISNTLRLKNKNLRQTRDLVLPKLISGEIDVSELDIDTNGIQPAKSGTHIPYPLTDHLHADEKILGGKPVIKGTRLAVAFILDLLKQGWSEKEVVDNYPNVAHEDIEACRAYEGKVTRASISG